MYRHLFLILMLFFMTSLLIQGRLDAAVALAIGVTGSLLLTDD